MGIDARVPYPIALHMPPHACLVRARRQNQSPNHAFIFGLILST